MKRIKHSKGLQLEKEAIKQFGITSNPKNAFYILKSGRMLNRQTENHSFKDIEHLDIYNVLPEKEKYKGDAIKKFCSKTGAVRCYINDKEIDIELHTKPTESQIKLIKSLAGRGRKIIVDAWKVDASIIDKDWKGTNKPFITYLKSLKRRT